MNFSDGYTKVTSSIIKIQDIPASPQIHSDPLQSAFCPKAQPSATTHLFSVTLVLPFLEFHMMESYSN